MVADNRQQRHDIAARLKTEVTGVDLRREAVCAPSIDVCDPFDLSDLLFLPSGLRLHEVLEAVHPVIATGLIAAVGLGLSWRPPNLLDGSRAGRAPRNRRHERRGLSNPTRSSIAQNQRGCVRLEVGRERR